MPTYKIGNVRENPREWQSQAGGPMLGYRMDMQDQATGEVTQNVEWSRKPTSAPPAAGQTVEGTIDTAAKYGPKFKQMQQQGGRGGGGGYRPRDPAENRSIAMQHAQKCAVTVLEVAAAHGDYHPPNASDVTGHVKSVAAALFLQVEDAAADKIKPGGNT